MCFIAGTCKKKARRERYQHEGRDGEQSGVYNIETPLYAALFHSLTRTLGTEYHVNILMDVDTCSDKAIQLTPR